MKHLSSNFPIYGCVCSVEDHGYVVACGIAGEVTFFLPYKGLPEAYLNLVVGQPVETVVDQVNLSSNSITLKGQRKAVSESLTRGANLQFTSLCPGMLLQATIDKIAINGLVVSFLSGLFHGVIDCLSLESVANDGWEKQFHVGEVVTARVVYVDHGGKTVRLSMRPHVIEFRESRHLPPLGASVCTSVISIL